MEEGCDSNWGLLRILLLAGLATRHIKEQNLLAFGPSHFATLFSLKSSHVYASVPTPVPSKPHGVPSFLGEPLCPGSFFRLPPHLFISPLIY